MASVKRIRIIKKVREASGVWRFISLKKAGNRYLWATFGIAAPSPGGRRGQIFEEQLDGWYRVSSSGPNRCDLDALAR
jgi:hypothetical protein